MSLLSRKPLAFASQILVLVAVLVVTLVLALALIFSNAFRQHAHKRDGAELVQLAERAATMFATGLQERSREILIMSQSPALWREGLASPAVAALLVRARAINPNSLWIGVAGAEGKVISATDNVLVGQNVAKRPWFAQGLARPYVGDVHTAVLLEAQLPRPSNGDPLRFLDFAAPIVVDGRVQGVLCAHVNWDWARQVSERVLPSDAAARGIEMFVFSRTGDLLYAPNGQIVALRDGGQRLPHGEGGGEGQEVRWTDGKTYLTAVVALATPSATTDLGWQVVVRATPDWSFGSAGKVLLLAVAGGFVVALAVCALAGVEARRLAKDLRLLAQAAVRIETGEHDVAIPLARSSHEVQNLSQALAGMTRRLITAHANMESQVAARTSELQAANQALDQLVRRDPLTGVLNRRGFEPKAQLLFDLAVRSHRPLSVCMIDADHFKSVNDTHGHAVGDEVLKGIAERLCSRIRRTDLLARWGGEEFVLLLPDTSINAAAAFAEDLRRVVGAHGHPTAGQITVSVGLAQTMQGDSSLNGLIARADQALYRAKHLGRNQVSVFAQLA